MSAERTLNIGLVRGAFRIVIGLLFVGHGAQKLLGWFGGAGLEAAEEEMEALGLRPARPNAILAGGSQMAAGGMLAAGLLTPVCSSVIGANMITAIRTACAGKGPWGLRGGWEYQLVLTIALLSFVEDGPGALSLDGALGIERKGTKTAALALAAAAGGAAAAIEQGRRAPAPALSSASDAGNPSQSEHESQ